jgi:hypothetical protein
MARVGCDSAILSGGRLRMEYVHLELGKDLQGLAGYYTPLKELRLESDGREVLCVIGMSVVESACCGGGTFGYASVPGYIVGWKERTNEHGLAVSRVEPVTDMATRREISAKIKETESIFNIDFW